MLKSKHRIGPPSFPDFYEKEAAARKLWHTNGHICPICNQYKKSTGIPGHIAKCLRIQNSKTESPATTSTEATTPPR